MNVNMMAMLTTLCLVGYGTDLKDDTIMDRKPTQTLETA